jgi:hypothetical protein
MTLHAGEHAVDSGEHKALGMSGYRIQHGEIIVRVVAAPPADFVCQE